MFHTQTTQRALYESLHRGDMNALAEVYPDLHRQVAALIRPGGGTPDEATDLLHEAILTTVYNIRYNRYTPTAEAQLTTYIIAIARNRWREHLRARQRLVPHNTDVPSPGDLPDEADETEADDRHFEARRLATETALAQLDPKCRRTLELYYWEKLSMAQLAERQGWANEAVARKTKSNCLRKLRQWVENQLANTPL
jgi:RNA polymerase sigma factor (sigma-70 family)